MILHEREILNDDSDTAVIIYSVSRDTDIVDTFSEVELIDDDVVDSLIWFRNGTLIQTGITCKKSIVTYATQPTGDIVKKGKLFWSFFRKWTTLFNFKQDMFRE